MSRLKGEIKVFDSITGDMLFSGTLNELFDKFFPEKVFFKSELSVSCDCFNFKFLF